MTNEAGEILKSGSLDRVADLVQRLAGPIADELGQMFGDKMRVYRVKNWVKTLRETDRILRDAGLSPNAVPPRLLIPIAENSSIEGNETLQEMWAGLLSTASQKTDALSPSFIETLKQLTPDEARSLEQVCEATLAVRKKPHLIEGMRPVSSGVESSAWGTYERLGLMQREYEVDARHGTDGDNRPIIRTEVDYRYSFTEYGVKFLDACHGPSSQTESESPKT